MSYIVVLDTHPLLQDALAFHVTFIKVSSNTSNTVIDAAMDAFLALSNELDYVIQLTTGLHVHTCSYSFMSPNARECYPIDSPI